MRVETLSSRRLSADSQFPTVLTERSVNIVFLVAETSATICVSSLESKRYWPSQFAFEWR